MAFLDNVNKAIVLRIVYAGPPMSGKTATLHALARHLLGSQYSNAVFTPEEASGRTLFFDWLEYAAGAFQGRKIRCQIVSVPGQTTLFSRRRALLESADSIVFVIDAHTQQRAAIERFYQEMRQVIAKPEGEPPVGVIVQANKGDLPDALTVDELRDLFDDSPNIAVVVTVATQGTGVREAFVQAVGVALGRVRELIENGALQAGDPDIQSGEDLLQRLRALEDEQFGALDPGAKSVSSVVDQDADRGRPLAPEELSAIIEDELAPAAASEPAPKQPGEEDPERHAPRLPDHRVGAGTVWPAVGGRIILHEIAGATRSVEQRADSAWAAEAGERWDLLSLERHRFETEAAAREEVLSLARLHARFKPLLSEHRCITAAESGYGDWRVWQVVRRGGTLAEAMAQALGLDAPEAIALELLRIGRALLVAEQTFVAAAFPHAPALRTLALVHGSPVYSGFLLPADTALSGAADRDAVALLSHEFETVVQAVSRRREIMPRVLRQLETRTRGDDIDRRLAETLIAMFLHHD